MAMLQRLFQQATQAQAAAPPATPELATPSAAQSVSDVIKSQLGLTTPQAPHPIFALSQPSAHYPPSPSDGREFSSISPVSSPLKASLETPKSSRPEVEPGVTLPSSNRVEYLIGSAGRRVQLSVTPITIYKTEEQYSLGQLIAVNSSFICYSVKGDMVRILAATNASLRALLRGHTKSVHDLAFAPTLEPDGAAIIATAAKDGQCLVWRIVVKEKEITTDVIAKPTADAGLFYTRVLWNPVQSRQLITIRSDSAVQVWNIDASSATCVHTLTPPGPVLCVAFNEVSIALGTKDGFVSLYSQDSGNILQQWQPHGGKAVTFLALRPHSIVTAARKNRVFRLWDLGTSRLAQELELTAREPKSLRNVVSFDASGRFLFVANTKSPTLYVIHASASRFDYASEFSVTYPILSFVLTMHQKPKSPDAADDDPLPPPETHVWCLQTAAIQRYHITESQSVSRRVLANEHTLLAPLGFELITSSVNGAHSLVPAAAAVPAPVVERALTPPSVPAPAETQPSAEAPVPPAAAATLLTVESAPTPSMDAFSNHPSRPESATERLSEEEEREWQRKVEEAHREQMASRQAEEEDRRAKLEALVSTLPPVTASVTVPPAEEITAPAAAPKGAATEDAQPTQEEAALRIQSAFRDHLQRRNSDPATAVAPVTTPVAAARAAAPEHSHASVSTESRTPQRAASSKKSGTPTKPKKDRAVVPAPGPAVMILPRPKSDAHVPPATAHSEPAPGSGMLKKSSGLASASSTGDAKSAKPEAQFDRHAARAVAEHLAPLIGRTVQAAVAAEMQALMPTLRAAATPTALPVHTPPAQLDKNEMRAAMQEAFAECFRATVLPAFERATQVMFSQMQAAFEHGLSENLRRMPVTPSVAAVPPADVTRLAAENAQLQSALTAQLRSATDTLIHLGETLQQRVDQPQPAAPAHTQSVGRKSKSNAAHEATAAPAAPAAAALAPASVPSTPERRKADKVSHTPAPSPAHAAEPSRNMDSAILVAGRPRAPSEVASQPAALRPLMSAPAGSLPPTMAVPMPLQSRGRPYNYEELFNHVLNANDLQMVTEACARHDPTDVFAVANLGPMILLPLIQQLGSDLSRALPPKISWLHACLVRLDPRDPVLAEVLPDVLHQLRMSIEAQRAVERDHGAIGALSSLHGLVSAIIQRL